MKAIKLINSILSLTAVAQGINATEKPNVVLIISDQHQFEALGCYGSKIKTINGESPTPNIDKLAAEGVLFTNAYTASPLSAPARASLITGTYPNKHTALHHKYNNTEPGHTVSPGILASFPTIGSKFRENGYTTAAIGKMHVHGEQKNVNDLGFDYSDLRFYTYFPGSHYSDRANGDWNKRYREMPPYVNMKYRTIDPVRFANVDSSLTVKMNNNNTHFIETLVEKEEQMFDYLVADESIKFMKKCAEEKKPFFIHVGFEKPHEPYTSPKKYMDRFVAQNMILPNSWDEVNKRGQYPFLMNWLSQKNQDSIRAKNTMAGYYAAINEMDEQVGKVIQACKDLGIYDNTIFIYTTDHGDNMYNHSLLQKHCMFEHAVKIPLIVSYPKTFPQNKVNNSLVSLLDIPPTILKLTGGSVPTSFDGISLTEAIDKKVSDERMIFSEFYEAGGNYKMFPKAKSIPMRMCRYKQFKYIYTHGFIEQLYDLKTDPDEMNNLVYSAYNKHSSIIEKLRLVTLNNWKIDEFPLFNIKLKRTKNNITFTCDDDSEVKEYILYRSTQDDVLNAKEIARSQKNVIIDESPVQNQTAFYWIIAIPKLTRSSLESALYKNTAIATQTLSINLPASAPVKVTKKAE